MDENRIKEKALNLRSPLETPIITLPRLTTNESFELLNTESHLVWIDFVNAHAYLKCKDDKYFCRAIRQVDLLLNDGVGMEWLSKAFKKPFLENLNGTDWIPKFLDQLSMQPLKLYIIGSKDAVAKKASDLVEKKWPNIHVIGYCHGFFQKDEEKDLIKNIIDSKVDLLMVCMGVPQQSTFVYRHLNELKDSTLKYVICGGGWIDFFSETVSRAPLWVRQLKMEWVWRLIQEPRRLYQRYIIGNIRMLWEIIKVVLK